MVNLPLPNGAATSCVNASPNDRLANVIELADAVVAAKLLLLFVGTAVLVGVDVSGRMTTVDVDCSDSMGAL